MAKDPLLIEGQAPLGRKIRSEPGARCDSVVQRDHSSMFAFLLGQRAWKGIAQSFDHLEERQIDVGNRVADENAAAVALQHLLKVIQKLRQTFGCEILRAALGFALLLLVIQAAGDRMMRVVNLGDPIGDGELQF